MSDTNSIVGATTDTDGSIDGAMKALLALETGSKPDKPEKKEKPEPAKPADEAPQQLQADDAEQEEPEAETASDEDDAEDAPSDQQDADEAEDASDEETLYTVKIDGKEEKVSLKEALAGYQRQQDYTRAKQALAEEKRAVQSEVGKAKEKEQVYDQLIPALVQRMQQYMPQPPDPSLIDTNPSAYLRQKEYYEREMGDLQAAAAEHQRRTAEQQEESAKRLQAYVAENAAKLTELVPEWKDERVASRDKAKVRDYLKGIGFSDQEIAQAYDARLVAMAADAARYRELRNSKPKAAAPVTEKPINPTAPSTAERKVNSKQKAYQAAKNRLRASGKVEDAASAILSLLG